MAASKRDFKDFYSFPGALNEGTGIYEFPTLYSVDDMERLRTWDIKVRIIKTGKKHTAIDWKLLEDKQVPILDDYFEAGDSEDYTDIPKGLVVQMWGETGIEGGKITRGIPTYFDKSAMEDKSNRRNAFQQAMIQARSLFLKRKEKGANERKPIKGKKVSTQNVMYFPMLAKPFKDGEKHLEFPLYIQPKLDGVRCLVFLKKKNDPSSIVIYTRTKKEFLNMDYLTKLLYPYLNDLYDEEKNQSIYLDGELYKHGKKLQDISGESRNEKKRPKNGNFGAKKDKEEDDEDSEAEDNVEHNEYHIYDCFYPKELDNAYSQRKEQLEALFEAMEDDEEARQYIKPVETIEVANMEEVQAQYEKFVEDNYEGAILRNSDGVYLANAEKTGSFMRSKDLVKLKKKFTDEYEVVDFKQGKKGKDVGAIIWIAQTKGKIKFNVTPKGITYEQRKKLYQECKKNFSKYKNRMLTVEYEDLSKAGVPQRAKAVAFRDYE